jgi:transcriptional regulator with GAF, ATPase, and Fis domain
MFTFMIDLYEVIASSEFLLCVTAASFLIKIYFLSILIPRGLRTAQILTPWFLLLFVLVGSLIGDFAWFFKLVREIWHVPHDYATVTFVLRIGWAFMVLQYQALALFIESLPESKFRLRPRHYLTMTISFTLAGYFFYLAFFNSILLNEAEREQAKRTIGTTTPLEIAIMRYVAFYLLYLLIVPSLIATIIKMRRSNFPKILYQQMRVFIQFLMAPYFFSEFLQTIIILFHVKQPHLYPIVSVSTMMLMYAVYYCIKRVMGLRFLNFSTRVQDHQHFNFIDDFKTILEQLSHVTSLQELNHLTQTFFKEAFDIPLRKTVLHLRKDYPQQANESLHELLHEQRHADTDSLTALVESEINRCGITLCETIINHKILVYDEVVFNNFYESDAIKKTLIHFLETINADIFIPLYEKNNLVGYIIVERHARNLELYSNIESDEMLVFANYINNIINLIRKRNLDELLKKEKELKDELYQKYQESSHYKESMHSFLRASLPQKIGIIFYKNRTFSFANQVAKELVGVDINKEHGHPLSQALIHVARLVEEYKSPQALFSKDATGKELLLNGVPNLEHNNVIITLYHPSVSDIIARHSEQLKNPTRWDYLLYLEATELGKQINTFIPGYSESLLHCKLDLFQAALSRKSLFLALPEDDLMNVVPLLHPSDIRDTIHILNLNGPERSREVAQQLFGLHHPSPHATPIIPLVKKVGKTGTIIIKNVQFLHLESQERLAELISYGLYRSLGSEQKRSCSARIMCTASCNIQLAVHEGTFSKNLWFELKKNTFSLPSLFTLPEHEFMALIDDLVEQAIRENVVKNILQLTDRDRTNLSLKRPASMTELRKKIHYILIQKSKKNTLDVKEIIDTFMPSVTDPELLEAAQLGKHALRDPKIMGQLWATFKNQNQIAAFLNVNRSSINRRCKEYNLQ